VRDIADFLEIKVTLESRIENVIKGGGHGIDPLT
jgi:hypothetical protein